MNRQWILLRTPVGALSTQVFELREAPIPHVGAGQVLIRNLMLSLDPAARAWMKVTSYRGQVMPGDVMHGFTIGQVVNSRSPAYKPGDVVECMGGWQELVLLTPDQLVRRNPNHSLDHLVSVYGITGTTAYHGIFDVGRVRPGEIVLVSAAAGAVGSIAGQLAKIAGCHVIGIAGGPEKCRWVVEELGFDAALDYKAAGFADQLREACPSGLDVFFDNVGGAVLDAALANLRMHARIVCCGSVSRYDREVPPPTSPLLPSVLTTRRARMEGFVVLDYTAQRPVAEEHLERWVTSGELKVVAEINQGLEHVPDALIRLLAGENRGKSAVQIGTLAH
jgi:NADPH-dependent curcumin reductase CurA